MDYSSLPASVVSAMSSNVSAHNDPPAPRGPPFHHMPNAPASQFAPQAPPLQQQPKYNPYLAAQHQMSAIGMAQGMTAMGGQVSSILRARARGFVRNAELRWPNERVAMILQAPVMNPSKLNPHQGQQSASSPWRSRPDARGPPMAGLPPTHRWNK